MNNAFNIEHLHFFVTTVEQGSITKAARQLHRDRTTVSLAISHLEDDLNVALFQRQGRSLSLTSHGEELYKHARSLIQHHQRFYNYSLSLQAGIEHSLTVCCDSFISIRDIQSINQAISQHFPNTQVNWQYLPSSKHVDEQLAERCDLSLRLFKNLDVPEVLQVKHLNDTKLVAVCHQQHHAGSSLTKFDDFRLRPLIQVPELEKVIRLDRINMVQQVGSIELAIMLLADKPSWSLLPLTAIQDAIESNQLVQVKLDIIDDMPLRRVLTWRDDVEQGQVKTWLINHIQSLI